MAGYQKPSNRHNSSYWVFRILSVAAILLSAYLIFEFGRIRADFNVVEAAAERRLYEDRITGLESEVRALQEKIVLLETDAAIAANENSAHPMQAVPSFATFTDWQHRGDK